MKLIIWYNTKVGKYDFGSQGDFQMVSKEFDLIYAQESMHLSIQTVSKLTKKLNENLAISKVGVAA